MGVPRKLTFTLAALMTVQSLTGVGNNDMHWSIPVNPGV